MKTTLVTLARHLAGACSLRKISAVLPGICLWCVAHAALPTGWQSQDVGTVGVPGSASYSGTTFTVTGAGPEVYYTADAFRFVYQAANGDCTIIARVATEQNSSQWAKVGVMIRESLANNAAYSFLFITPDQVSPNPDRGILFESRASTGASATQTSNLPGYLAPYWLKLVRTGNTFTASRSADGVTWATVGTQTLSFTSSVLIGLVVCSHADPATNTSTFDNVSVSNGLPAPWATWDVGAPGAIGSASYNGTTFTVSGAGGEVFYSSGDAFRFVYRTLTGDGMITARVATEQNTSQWAKVGVMFRESLTDNSAYSFLFITPDQPSPNPDRGILFESRASTGAGATQTSNLPGYVAPYWLRLQRTGNMFTASRSTDGATWTVIGSQTLSLASSLQAGLVVCSHTAGVLNTSTFDNVSTTGSTYKTLFPKLAGINFGDKHYEVSAYQADLAKLDMIILGFYKGWNYGMTIRTAVQNIKALHPEILIGNYTLLESHYNPQQPTAADYDIYTKLNSEIGPTANGGTWTPNDWWAHDPSGALLYHGSYTSLKLVNITNFTTPDANNQRFTQWMADRSYNVFFSPVPEFDIWFVDNILYRPRESGVDWQRRGAGDSRDDANVRTYYRQGNVEHLAQIQARKPGVLVMGNIESNSSGNPPAGSLRETQYAGLFAGAFLESASGRSWSEESQTNGWNVMMSSYRSLMDNTIAPHLVILNVKGVATDYATFRYLFASALMEDGYFSYSREEPVGSGQFPYSNVTWFDEYDLAGTSTTTWLGAAVDPKQRTAKSNGIYVRRFQNGLAITNPKGNGTQTIDLSVLFPGETYRRINGTQDPTTNNGAVVTTLTLNARDGLILKK